MSPAERYLPSTAPRFSGAIFSRTKRHALGDPGLQQRRLILEIDDRDVLRRHANVLQQDRQRALRDRAVADEQNFPFELNHSSATPRRHIPRKFVTGASAASSPAMAERILRLEKHVARLPWDCTAAIAADAHFAMNRRAGQPSSRVSNVRELKKGTGSEHARGCASSFRRSSVPVPFFNGAPTSIALCTRPFAALLLSAGRLPFLRQPSLDGSAARLGFAFDGSARRPRRRAWPGAFPSSRRGSWPDPAFAGSRSAIRRRS